MLGIEIIPENLPEITQTLQLAGESSQHVELDRFIASPKKWYFITGYITRRGKIIDWTIVPAYILEGVFDFDRIKIKTDWTNVVRTK